MQIFRILVALLIVSTGAVAGFRQINGGAVNKATVVTTAAGTTTAIATSNQVYIFEGSTTQNFVAPNATTLPVFWYYDIINNSTGTVTFKDSTSATVGTVSGGRQGKFILSDNSTAAGTWKLNVPAAPGDIITDHGNLTGLSDDDHTQYHNNTRGDARYYQKSEHLNSSAGAANAGSPIVLNSSGKVDDSMLPSSSTSAWSKDGNAATTAGTNFLGTTDPVDLVIKTNNSEVFRFKNGGLYDTNLSTGVIHSDASGLLDSRGVINGDIDATANIAYSKLNLAESIRSSDLKNGEIINEDIAATANVAYSKLNLASSITSSDITDGTIVNNDINASAGIVDTKLATIATAGKVSNSATTATSANTNSAIVARDGSGNFSATTITAALSGNATTATSLAANPTDCSANQFANAIDAQGNLTCAAPAGASTGNTTFFFTATHGSDCQWTDSTSSYPTFADFPVDSGCTFTVTKFLGFDSSAISSADSGSETNKYPGVQFTPPIKGWYKITARIQGRLSTAEEAAALEFYDGSTSFGAVEHTSGSSSTTWRNDTVTAVFEVTSLSSMTIRLRGVRTSGNFIIGSGSTINNGATWTVEKYY